MSNDWSQYSLQGCLFESSPGPAPELRVSASGLPDRVDLRAHCSPVEQQATTNSCVANAVAGAMEYLQKKSGQTVTDMSRLFIYYNARTLSGSERQDFGTQIHHGIAALLAYGACEERLWPFNIQAVNQRPAPRCYENASRYEAVQYARTPRGEAMQAALAQGLPIVFGMFAPSECYSVAAQTGIMPKPTGAPPVRVQMGHAMLIVGYDRIERSYLVRNSWGAHWGDQGYCRIPFETLDHWSHADQFWTIGELEKPSGFMLSGTSMFDAMKSVGVPEDLLRANTAALNKLTADTRTDVRTRLSQDLEAAKRDFRSRLRDPET